MKTPFSRELYTVGRLEAGELVGVVDLTAAGALAKRAIARRPSAGCSASHWGCCWNYCGTILRFAPTAWSNAEAPVKAAAVLG